MAEKIKSKNEKSSARSEDIKKHNQFTTSFQIFANKAALWQPKAPLAVLIEDENLIQIFKGAFEYL